jgi:putative membrane protein
MMTGLAGMAMWLMMGLMLIGITTGAITWTRRRLHRRPGSHPTAPGQTPEEILRRRYAAGQINRDEYLRHQRDLSQH